MTHADEIVVLHEGSVAERGSHAELLARGGRYAAMWQRQETEEVDAAGAEAGLKAAAEAREEEEDLGAALAGDHSHGPGCGCG